MNLFVWKQGGIVHVHHGYVKRETELYPQPPRPDYLIGRSRAVFSSGIPHRTLYYSMSTGLTKTLLEGQLYIQVLAMTSSALSPNT